MSLYKRQIVRGYILRICPLVFLTLILCISSSGFAVQADKPVKDKSLQSRLILSKKYTSRDGDTLKKIAYRVYGHKTWWAIVRKDNKKLRNYGPDKLIPAGLKISYKAPEINGYYRVMRNDTLSRIAEWKYGDLDIWNIIYEKNKDKIERPNLIEPGMTLSLEADGTIKNAQSGEVLISGAELSNIVAAEQAAQQSAQTRPPFVQAPPPAEPTQFDSIPKIKRFYSKEEVLTYLKAHPEYVFIGIGVLLLLLILLFIRSIIRIVGKAGKNSLESYRTWQYNMHRRKYYFNFEVDRSLLSGLEGKLDNRPTYLGIMRKILKRYIK
jgi:phage tail protein X